MLHDDILKFINDFKVHDTHGVIEDTFTGGYCYYFAQILKQAFPNGVVCLAAPFGHFVYLAPNCTAYDVTGEYAGEALYFIPEDKLDSDVIQDFKHIPNVKYKAPTREDCIQIIKKYCKSHNLIYSPKCESYLL